MKAGTGSTIMVPGTPSPACSCPIESFRSFPGSRQGLYSRFGRSVAALASPWPVWARSSAASTLASAPTVTAPSRRARFTSTGTAVLGRPATRCASSRRRRPSFGGSSRSSLPAFRCTGSSSSSTRRGYRIPRPTALAGDRLRSTASSTGKNIPVVGSGTAPAAAATLVPGVAAPSRSLSPSTSYVTRSISASSRSSCGMLRRPGRPRFAGSGPVASAAASARARVRARRPIRSTCSTACSAVRPASCALPSSAASAVATTVAR